MYPVVRGDGLDVARHCARLTMRPVEHDGADVAPFEAFELTDDTLWVPRFYGLCTWGPDGDASSAGAASAAVFTGTLLPHQVEALEALRRYDADGAQDAPHSNGRTLCLPCGKGKTVSALQWICGRGRRALVLVHKEFLASQWEAQIARFTTASVGRIQRDRVDVGDITVAMIQSLSARDYDPEVLKSFGTLVLDEAHHIAARQFSQVMRKLPARHVLALTATPERKDGCTQLLYWLAGSIAHRGTRDDERAAVHMHLYEQHRVRERTTADGRVQMAGMVTDLARDAHRTRVICDLVRRRVEDGHCVIVLSERIAQLKEIERGIQGVPEVHWYVGATKPQARRDCETTARVVLSTYQMAAEGLDIPRLSCLVLATPRGDVVQSVGRIQRPCPDKLPPVVDDLVDPYSVFSGLRYKRLAFYRRSGFRVA